MEEDRDLQRIAEDETRARIARILRVIQGEGRPWQEVYGDAHTLAGIADDATVADAARDMAKRLRDERGAWVAPAERDENALRKDVAALAAWLDSRQT